jgi:hypothetical protein
VKYVLRDHDGTRAEAMCELEGVGGSEWRFANACPTLLLRHDATSDVWIASASGFRAYAFREAGMTAGSLWPRDVAASIAPPIGFSVGGAIGVTSGLALLVAGAFARRRACSTPDVVEAFHAGGGETWLPDARKVHAARLVALPIGSVLVRLRERGQPTYRTMAVVEIEPVFVGTLDDWRRALRDRAASFDACALMAVLLTATPLLSYWL